MSKIKVDDIAPSSSNTPSITLGTNSNVSFANGVTATSFTGNGANLTNVPAPSTFNAANLTGTIPDARFPATLPAIDGSNLTGIGGGPTLEFVKKIQPSSNVSTIVETGLDYDTVYRFVFKKINWTGLGNLRIEPHVDNMSTPHNQSDCFQGFVNYNFNTGGQYAPQWNMYPALDKYYAVAVFDFYTGVRAWGMGHYYTVDDASASNWNGWKLWHGFKSRRANTNNDSNQTDTYAKVNGYTFSDIYGNNFTTETEIVIFKYRES